MKKSIKLFFCGKIDAQISRVAGVKKVSNSLKKKFFEKKILIDLFVQIRRTKRCAEIFLKQTGLEVLNFR